MLSACGAGSIEEAEVEASVAAELAAELDQPEPNIDCPSDLKAEVGATMECELTVDGDENGSAGDRQGREHRGRHR